MGSRVKIALAASCALLGLLLVIVLLYNSNSSLKEEISTLNKEVIQLSEEIVDLKEIQEERERSALALQKELSKVEDNNNAYKKELREIMNELEDYNCYYIPTTIDSLLKRREEELYSP